MIELISLSKKFNKVQALKNVSLKVNPGTITAFLGPNGAGKTTAMKIAAGINYPDSGDVKISDHSIITESFEAKKNLGFLPDMPMLHENVTGIDYINFILDIFEIPTTGRKNMVEGYFKRFNLLDKAKELIEGYSLGMKRKLSFIAAICHSPRAIILDEPTLGLDPSAILEMKLIIQEAASNGSAILFSTHILDIAEKLCNNAVIIDRGIVIASGTIDELHKTGTDGKNNTLEEVFLKLTENLEY